MSKADYYDLLGVQKNASDDELKKAYRKMAMKYHPDRNAGDKSAEKKFKEINEAYDILKDSQKRAAYDQYGHAAFDPAAGGGAGRGFGGGNPFGGGAGGFGAGFGGDASFFEDVINEFMGGGRRRGGAQASNNSGRMRGADLRYNLDITLEDAFYGKKIEIKYPTSVVCGTCSGSGAKPGSQSVSCTLCHGMGKVRVQQGFFTIERTCPSCHGEGITIDHPCGDCSGQGRVQKQRKLQIKIPQGIKDGVRMRIKGEGEAGTRGAPNGDLYAYIHVKEHELFKRHENDLYFQVPVSMSAAALGDAIEVPTIDGKKIKMNLKAGIQTGDHLRVRGKGMSVTHGSHRGDMIIEVFVETPVKLSQKQKSLLREFAGEQTEKNSPQSNSFFDSIKQFFTN